LKAILRQQGGQSAASFLFGGRLRMERLDGGGIAHFSPLPGNRLGFAFHLSPSAFALP
jgi:hypothetical protein